MASAKARAEAIWLHKLLYELGFLQLSPTTIYSHGQSAIALGQNPKFHLQSKYVDTQYHFTSEKVLSHEIYLAYIPTFDMTMDILIKYLSTEKLLSPFHHFYCHQKFKLL